MEISQSAILVISFIAIAVITFFTYKKKEEWFSRHKYPIAVWMVFVSFILSLSTFICVVFFNAEIGKCSFRYSDTSVTIITLLVTILVGWNIFQVIDVKSVKTDAEKLKATKEEIDKKLNEKLSKDDFVFDIQRVLMLERRYANMAKDPAMLFKLAIETFNSKIYDEDSASNTLSYEYAYQTLNVLSQIKGFDAIKFAKDLMYLGLKKEDFDKFNSEYIKGETNDNVRKILRVVEDYVK